MMSRKPKLMPIPEAIEEGRRWLAYLDRQAERAKRLAELASERRAGTMDLQTAQREIERMERNVTVYDGANLAEAVKALIENAERLSRA